MRKIFAGMIVVLCMILSVQAEVNKEEFFARMTQKYSGIESISGEYEINMPMMGSIMKMPVKFWQKGNKMRMDMTMNQPGMPKPMEQSILMDGEKMIQYQKMMNTVMTVDFNKLPDNMRQMMKKQQAFMMNQDSINQFYQVLDRISIEERTKDGKALYLITVSDIPTMGNISPAPGMQISQNMFKKLLVWINPSSLLPEKIELLGDGDTPAMWIDILNIKIEDIPDSIFKLDIPADAKYMDITEAVKNMAESINMQ